MRKFLEFCNWLTSYKALSRLAFNSAEHQFVICAVLVHRVPTIHEVAIFILFLFDETNDGVLHGLLLFEALFEVELIKLDVACL